MTQCATTVTELYVVLDTMVAIRVGRWARNAVVDYDLRSPCHTVEDNVAARPGVESIGTGATRCAGKSHRDACQLIGAWATATYAGVIIGDCERARQVYGRTELDLP